MKRSLSFFTILVSSLLLAVQAAAGDLAAGKTVAERMCQTCHGLDGVAEVPIAPHIGGEPKTYLENQLMAFKTGAREHEMMTIVAAGLSVQQIDDVSAWYAAHAASAELAASADPDQAPAQCVSCHGVDGISQLLDAPNLAGETSIYIDTQLKAFKRGKRKHEIMSAVAAELTDQEIRAISDWYAAINLRVESPE